MSMRSARSWQSRTSHCLGEGCRGFSGKRIKSVHLNEWDKRTQASGLNTFRTLIDGTTSWPAVISELERIGYERYLTLGG